MNGRETPNAAVQDVERRARFPANSERDDGAESRM
jgi:hypothetical protein